MSEKKNKVALEKTISYWSKQQELDKFNYNLSINQIDSQITFLGAFFIPLILSGISLVITQKYLYGFIIVVFCAIVFPIMLWFFGKNNRRELKNAKEAFRMREAMLRVFYNDLGVNTDLLDQQFEEIKKEYHNKNSNKELERIAKEKMKR